MKQLINNRVIQALGIGIVTSLVSFLLYFSGTLGWLERPIWDWRVRWLARPGAATDDIVTIMIDQNSLDDARDQFGFGWPWPRQVYAYILDFVSRGGAKAIAFDLIFTDASAAGGEDDALFGQAIARGIPFVGAFSGSQTTGAFTEWPMDINDIYPEVKEEQRNMIQTKLDFKRASFPVPEVRGNASLLGNVMSSPDDDAVFRSMFPFRVFDNRWVPNLGLATVLATAGPDDLPINIMPRHLTVGTRRIPLTRQGEAVLRYRGPTQTHRAFNATAILQSEARLLENREPLIDPEVFKGKTIFLGATAPGLMDLKPTPVGRTYPGMEVHATFLDNFLSDDFIQPLQVSWVIALAIGISLLSAVAVRCGQRAMMVCMAYPLFSVIVIGAGFLAYHWNMGLPVAPVLVSSLLAMTSALVVNFALEGRQKRFIKQAFRQYLSPVVIDRLLASPDHLVLGGEEKTLSILFSDVQGFTSISERLSPSQLTSLLNEYLTAMTDIIHQHGGTIDKYEGDAIIAFWNAPLDQEDHATRAIRAGLECNETLMGLREDFQQRYQADLIARIGINTGPVVVGNMGSRQRFDYSFLGDAGNLASRLEGINKAFGTRLLVSEDTLRASHYAFPAREISRIRVVGRQHPVTVYEPLLETLHNKQHEHYQKFNAALQLYYQGDFTEAQARFEQLSHSDPAATSYVQRCSQLVKNHPREWDGIWEFTEK